MLDKTLQFGKRMMHQLSENISGNDKRVKTSNYQLLIELINVRLSLKWQPLFVHYFFKIAVGILSAFSTSISISYICIGHNKSSKKTG